MPIVSCYASSPASQTRLPLGTPNSCHHSCFRLCESLLQFRFSFFQSQFPFSELQLLNSVLCSSNSVGMDFFLLPIDEFGKASASTCESSEYHQAFSLLSSGDFLGGCVNQSKNFAASRLCLIGLTSREIMIFCPVGASSTSVPLKLSSSEEDPQRNIKITRRDKGRN